jgi:flavin-binding protein dodecin
MGDVFKSIELVGASSESFEDAVRLAVRRAGKSMRNLEWLEVMDQRAYIKGGDVQQFQVTVRVWFKLDE